MLLLLACADPDLKEVETGDTEGDPNSADTCETEADTCETEADTSDTGVDSSAVWEPPVLACPLAHPRAVSYEALPPLWQLYGTDVVTFRVFAAEFFGYEREWGCPESTVDGGSQVWQGDCTGEGVSWEGRWAHTDEGDFDAGPALAADEGDDVHFVDTDWTGWDVAFDGHSMFTQDASGGQLIDRDFRLSLLGYTSYPEIGGEWEVRSYERWVPGVSYTMEGFYDAVPDEGEAGDYCLYAEAYEWPGCEDEPRGGWVLQGTATLVVTWDPDVACDGCGNATLDGVSAGLVCDTTFAYIPR